MIAKASCLHPLKDKDSYLQASEEDEAQFQAAYSEYRKLEAADFARIARSRRQRSHSKSGSSRSPLPVRRQTLRQSTNQFDIVSPVQHSPERLRPTSEMCSCNLSTQISTRVLKAS